MGKHKYFFAPVGWHIESLDKHQSLGIIMHIVGRMSLILITDTHLHIMEMGTLVHFVGCIAERFGPKVRSSAFE